MKAIRLFVFFFLCFIKVASSQILIGPEVGGNSSWTRFDDRDMRDIYSSKPVWGYSAGAHLGFRVQKRYFLHASLLYSTKGRILTNKKDYLENNAVHLRNKVRYNYIEMPIIYTIDFKGKLGGNKEFKYNIGGGPIVSYWLGGKGRIENQEIWEDTPGPVDYRISFRNTNPSTNEMGVKSFNRIQLGLNVTASLIFEPMPKKRIMLTARYEIGSSYLSKVNSGTFHDTQYKEPLQTRNRGIRISVAYLFDINNEQRKKGKTVSDKKKGKNITIRKRR